MQQRMASGWCGALTFLIATSAAARRGLDDDQEGVRGRGELAARVAAALAQQAEPKAAELVDKERAFGLALEVFEARGVRVLATSGADEARRVARTLEAARELHTQLSGAPAYYPSGLSVYLLGTRAAKDAFLKKHPGLGPETSARLGKLECAGVDGTADWAFWQEDPEQRLDGALRLAFDWLFRAQRITLDGQAWLHEGLGFYLTHAFTGTYLTWMVPIPAALARRDPENIALHAQMKEPGADWLALARGLFAPQHGFDLEELLHLAPQEFDPSDTLRMHALAAFLVEVRPAVLGDVLTRAGAGEDPRVVLEEALACPLAEVRTRLDAWLEHREALVAKAEGRRTDAELLAQWGDFGAVRKRAAVAELERRLAELDTQQLRWLRALTAGAPAEVPQAADAPFFDPKTHAPAQPIARKRLSGADARVKRLLKDLRPADPRAPLLVYDYDWASAQVVRRGNARDPEVVFHNALLGLPPGADLARALVLSALDHPEERKLQAAFAHAYTDREGNVYPLSLYELWATGETIEMPDVDTLGILHDVKNEWNRWVAPVPGTQHEALYKVLGELYSACRSSREMRLSLAELYLAPAMTPRKGYESLAFNLQAAWSEHDSDPVRLAASLPAGKEIEAYRAALVERCKQDYALYAKGRRRAALLRQDALELRKALGAALEAAAVEQAPPEEGASETPPGGGR